MAECGKRGNPRAGFPRFPRLLGNLADGARFPHLPQLRRPMADWRETQKQESRLGGRWKSGNPKAGFPLFHRPGSLRQKEEKPGVSDGRKRDTSIEVRPGTFLKRLDKGRELGLTRISGYPTLDPSCTRRTCFGGCRCPSPFISLILALSFPLISALKFLPLVDLSPLRQWRTSPSLLLQLWHPLILMSVFATKTSHPWTWTLMLILSE